MLNCSFLFKSARCVPFLTTQRWKINILPDPDRHIDDGTELEKNKNKIVDVFSFLHRKRTFADVKHWYKWRKIEKMRENQRYIPERHQTLGPDLAATHFLTHRYGKIRFVGNNKWMTDEDIAEERIPSFFVPGFFIEEIDASGMYLCYEGIENLCNLVKLKKLNLSNCRFIDDWCLGRFYLFANTLEYLDLTGCQLVTERGICALHTLKKLKTLVINDTPNIRNRELISLLLQDIIPNCNIIGVNFNDPVLLKRIENFIH